MKAFFGAIVLTLVSAVVGVFAATELHEMTSTAGGSSAIIRADTVDAAAEQESEQIKQRVNYSVQRDIQQVPAVADDI